MDCIYDSRIIADGVEYRFAENVRKDGKRIQKYIEFTNPYPIIIKSETRNADGTTLPDYVAVYITLEARFSEEHHAWWNKNIRGLDLDI